MLVLAAAVSLTSCGSDGPTELVVGGLRFVAQPVNTAAGTQFSISVELVTDAGKRVTSATDMVTLGVTGSATLTGTTTVAAVAGVATFSGLTLTKTGSNYQLTATSGSYTNTSGSFTVDPGPASADQTTVTLASQTLTPNVATSATFSFRDAFNNAIANKQITLTSNLAGLTFNPSSGTTDANGNFQTNITATAVGTATLSANVAGISVTISAPVTVQPGASAIRFVTQPANVQAGVAFSVSVEIVSAQNQRVTTATNPIVLTVTGATVNGLLTTNAVAGLATFSNLTINNLVANAQFTATGAGFTAQSNAFAVAAGPASSTQSTAALSATLITGTSPTLTLTVKDALSNVIAGGTVSLTTTVPGLTFGTPTGTTSASGVFTTTLIAPATPGTGNIVATVNGTALTYGATVLVPCANSAALTIGTPYNGTVDQFTGCTGASLPAAFIPFTIPAGPPLAYSFTVTGQAGFSPGIGIQTTTTGGIAVIIPAPSATPTVNTREYFMPGGAYLMKVASMTGAPGAFTLASVQANPATGCLLRGLVGVTMTLSLSLASSDCTDTSPGGPYYYDEFVFSDTRSCTISMQASYPVFLEFDDAFTGAGIYATQTVVNSDQQTFSPCTSPAGNPLAIFPSSAFGSVTGAYTLTVTMAGGGNGAASIRIGGSAMSDLFAPRPKPARNTVKRQ